MKGFVYILSNKNRTVLYIGATKDLRKRVQKHIAGKASEFTKRYNVTELMYFEILDSYHEAFLREKQLKNWRKSWKWNLIKAENPKLENLYLNLRTS
jgi:putative endonuclease